MKACVMHIVMLSRLAILAALLTACSAQINAEAPLPPTLAPSAAPTRKVVSSPTAELFTDPFTYCASAGTIDAPDKRYSGAKITDEIVKGYLTAAGIAPTSNYSDIYKKMTIWRCMDKKVYACNFGANLPCDSKADTNKIPTQAMNDFCKENKDSDFIPMSVTGHATIYSWHCVKEQAELLDQVVKVDQAGYLSNIWYAVVSPR